MPRRPWVTYLWPGLPQLWFDGAWAGLAAALGFAVLVNLLVLVSFVWKELLTAPLLAMGWIAVAVVWLTAIVVTGRKRQQIAAETAVAPAEDLFCAALNEYLQGNWFEAETLLGRMFEHRPRDVEARLLLATLLRRTKRHREAREQLARLERIEGAEHWSLEIAHEKRLLAEASPPPQLWTSSLVAEALSPAAKAA